MENNSLYRSNGQYFGFIYNNHLFYWDGSYLGWIEGTHAWDKSGQYRGELTQGRYILRNLYSLQPIPRMPKIPPPLPSLPPPSGNIAPITLPIGVVDAF